MGIFTYKLINVTMLSQSRHIITPILFIIPYFIIGLDYILDHTINVMKTKNKNLGTAIMVIVTCFFIVTSSYTAIAKNPYITPDYVSDVSKWIKTNVKSNETILLDEYNWWGLHIIFFSGLNTTLTGDYLKTFEYATGQIRTVSTGGKKIDDTVVMSYLENDPTYLIYSPKGKLTDVLNFSSRCQNETYRDYLFECKYQTKNYNIYRVTWGKIKTQK